MIIVLLGYMASGKSFIGKHLAEKLNYNFIDLDKYIEIKENQLITSLFKLKGEIYFRKIETKYLKEILSYEKNIVLALGGGTPCYAYNMNTIIESENCKSFYLKSSIPTLVKRLLSEKENRPLVSHLKNEEELTEFVGKHLFERNNYYSKSKNIITTDNKDIEAIVESIIFKLF